MDVIYKKSIKLCDFAKEFGVKNIVDIVEYDETIEIELYDDVEMSRIYDREEFYNILKERFIGQDKEIVSFYFTLSYPLFDGMFYVGYKDVI